MSTMTATSARAGGMTRVRGFTQDDAHLFCTEEQVQNEILGCLSLVKKVLTTLGMSDYRVRVGLRVPPRPLGIAEVRVDGPPPAQP